jgi:3-hydroxybutyryl-CoA dehydratase
VADPPADGGEPPRLYFEDVEVGVPLETPALTLTEAHVAMFAGVTGERRDGRAPAVPDLLPLCISSGLTWRVPAPPLAVMAFMGFEWRFLRPARVGDTIRSRSRTLAKRSMRDGGVVVEEREILNQRGELVQSGKITLLVARRRAGRKAPA